MTSPIHLTFLELYIILIMILLLVAPCSAQPEGTLPTIEAASPITDVVEGGMLSIHCLFHNLDIQKHAVFIIRNTSGGMQRLTLNGDIMPNIDDERVFIATRQLGGGGEFAYFLTVVEITGDDSGEYICQVVTESTLSVITKQAVTIDVMHFPTGITCNPPNPSASYIGDIVSMSCTAGRTYSAISTHWVRASTKEKLDSERITDHNGQVFEEIHFQTTLTDVGAVFICEITSPYFPSKKLSCPVGPLSLSVDPSKQSENNLIESSVTAILIGNQHIETPKTMESCKSTCAVYKSPAIYWIIGTVIACSLAFVFFIVALVLCIKIGTIPSQPEFPDTLFSLHPSEDIYAQLEGRVDGSRLYMTLERPKKSNRKETEANTRQDGHYLMPFLQGPQL